MKSGKNVVSNGLKNFVAEVICLFFLQNEHKAFGKTCHFNTEIICNEWCSNVYYFHFKINTMALENNKNFNTEIICNEWCSVAM
jgi:hypothetical protein